MFSAILGKFVGGVVFSSGSVVLLGYVFLKEDIDFTYLSQKESDNINIYAISQKNDDVDLEEININNKNYLCKFDDIFYECTIAAVEDFDTTKKWLDFKGVAENKSVAITNESLRKEKIIYRIYINKSVGNWLQEYKNIELVPKSDNKNSIYASLKPIFALNYNNTAVDKYVKTKHFVVKTGKLTDPLSIIDTLTTTKCTVSDKTISSSADSSDCGVHELKMVLTTKLNSLKLTMLTMNENVRLESNKFYLIELNKKQSVSWLKHMKIVQTSDSNKAVGVDFDDNSIVAIHLTEKAENMFIFKTLSATGI